MRLNESREWSEDLTVASNEFKAKFLKPRVPERAKQSMVVNTRTDKSVSTKKVKKTKKSRFDKWAETLKKVESVDQASPMLQEPQKIKEIAVSVQDEPEKPVLRITDSTAKTEKEEIKVPVVDDKPKYEIKLVAKYRFPSTTNIKAIDNLSILKNLSVLNMKNVFVIKNNYKTYVFTLTDNNPDATDIHRQNAKASILTTSNDNESKSFNKSAVYLKLYGISEPEEKFLKDIIKTIKDQVEQIALMDRATSIYKSQPNQADYDFIKENGEKLFICYKLPKFIINYLKFISQLRSNMKSYFTLVVMGSAKCIDTAISNVNSRPSSSTLKRSFKGNANRSSFYIRSHMFSSVAGEKSEDLLDVYPVRDGTNPKGPIYEENEDMKSSELEPPQPKESMTTLPRITVEPKTVEDNIALFFRNYDSDDYTFLHNGFSSDISKNMDKKAKSKMSREQILMTTFGTCLSTLCLGLNISKQKDFNDKIKNNKFDEILSVNADKEVETANSEKVQPEPAKSQNLESEPNKRFVTEIAKSSDPGLFENSSKKSIAGGMDELIVNQPQTPFMSVGKPQLNSLQKSNS